MPQLIKMHNLLLRGLNQNKSGIIIRLEAGTSK
jgi:hypothetical protein